MKIETREKYLIVTADEGMRITTHTGDDYTDYSSWGSARVGLNADLSSWYEISEAEDEENIKLQIEQLALTTSFVPDEGYVVNDIEDYQSEETYGE